MRNRCQSEKNRDYSRYGGRGIQVCERWASFENFVSDMGKKPSPQHTLDRLDPDKDYTPDNCRWATRLEQTRNRSNTMRVEYKGEMWNVAELAQHSGTPYDLLRYRIKRLGMSAETALMHLSA